MRLYQKYFPGNYNELIACYPQFYRDVLEMRAILEAHGAIADRLEADIERVYLNSFIDCADEATISELEEFLDIRLNRERTLEERRRLVKTFFIGFGKLSASMIVEMVRDYTSETAEVRFEPSDDAGNNTLYLYLPCDNLGAAEINDIFYILEKRIPAHINWQVIFQIAPAQTVYAGAGVDLQMYQYIQTDLAVYSEQGIESPALYAGAGAAIQMYQSIETEPAVYALDGMQSPVIHAGAGAAVQMYQYLQVEPAGISSRMTWGDLLTLSWGRFVSETEE